MRAYNNLKQSLIQQQNSATRSICLQACPHKQSTKLLNKIVKTLLTWKARLA